MRHAIALLGALALVGCANTPDNNRDTGFDFDDGQGQEGSKDGVSPFIKRGFVECFDSGMSAGIFWQFTLVADDPQGDFTLKRFDLERNLAWIGTPTEAQSDAAITCEAGECTGSIGETAKSVTTGLAAWPLCSQASEVDVYAQVADDDGNVSDPLLLTFEGEVSGDDTSDSGM